MKKYKIVKLKNNTLIILSPIRYNRKLKKGDYFTEIRNLSNNMSKEGLKFIKIRNYYWYLIDFKNKNVYNCETFHNNSSETFIIDDLEKYLTINKKLELLPEIGDNYNPFNEAIKILYGI